LSQLGYFVVDVFAVAPLQGNPLAVAMNTCGLTTEKMQAMARESNLSETTFAERRAAEVEGLKAARSLTSSLAVSCLPASACISGKAWRSAGPAIFSRRHAENRRGSGMCASGAAPFLWQKDSFSCRDAHAFNRNSSSQVTSCVDASRFRLVTGGFSVFSSLKILSFQNPPVLVLFRFVAHISLERLRGSCLTRQNTEH
jgi:hypothetical protein